MRTKPNWRVALLLAAALLLCRTGAWATSQPTGDSPVAGEPAAASTSPATDDTATHLKSFESKPTVVPATDEGGILGNGIKATGSLLLVLALIMAAAYLLKRYMPRQFGGLGENRVIHILETASLGEKRSLTVVRIGEEHFLIGSTPQSVALLEKIQPSAKLGLVKAETAEEPPRRQTGVRSSFSFKLSQAWGTLRKRLDRLSLVKRPIRPKHRETGEPSFRQVIDSELAGAGILPVDTVSEAGGAEVVISRLAEIRRNLQEQ